MNNTLTEEERFFLKDIRLFITNRQQVDIPISKDGMYAFPNQKVIVPSTRITMKDIPHPILAITDNGQREILEPNKEYQLKGNSTLEIPITEDEKRFLEELNKR